MSTIGSVEKRLQLPHLSNCEGGFGRIIFLDSIRRNTSTEPTPKEEDRIRVVVTVQTGG